MKFSAEVHLVVRVPFTADVDELGEPEMVEKENGKAGVADPAAHDRAIARVERQRRKAAQAAIAMANALTVSDGEIVSHMVSEVTEA